MDSPKGIKYKSDLNRPYITNDDNIPFDKYNTLDLNRGVFGKFTNKQYMGGIYLFSDNFISCANNIHYIGFSSHIAKVSAYNSTPPSQCRSCRISLQIFQQW